MLLPTLTVVDEAAVGRAVESRWLLPIDTAVGAPLSGVACVAVIVRLWCHLSYQQSSSLLQVELPMDSVVGASLSGVACFVVI